MLDDSNVLRQKDPSGALDVATAQADQTSFAVSINQPEHDNREITRIVVAGMGGSALAALLAKSWLSKELTVPIEIVRSYSLPAYVDSNTLVIASSYSGNTEETLSSLEDASSCGSQIAIIAAGGKLIERAEETGISFVQLPSGLQPRMAVIYNLRALVALLAHFQLVSQLSFDEIADAHDWLSSEVQSWKGDVPVDRNYAKQIALLAVGKTPVFYAGSLMAPIAYKWKISWNENAKNVAFWNEYPEFNHNEFMGWASHPVEKPFAVFDIISNFEHERILKRFDISDRLLSGRRPKANVIQLQGDTPLKQMLWGSILADYASIYVAILNGIDPTPVELIEKLKLELG